MFSYKGLKKAEESGMKLGSWRGLPVFSCKKDNLKNLGSGVYYIVYDDDRKIVSKKTDGGIWFECGTVNDRGIVNEYDKMKIYGGVEIEKPNENLNSKNEMKNRNGKMDSKNEMETNGKMNSKSEMENRNENLNSNVEVDFLLNAQVERVLKGARALTIGELLDGFNYGLG